MNTRKGQVGVALAALLVVACGDAAVGMVMEDGGGVVDDAGVGMTDLGGMLVDMGMGLMDAGHQVSDAGETMRDMGEGMDSAVAQGPGPWMNATCAAHEYVSTSSVYVYTVETWTTTFTAPASDRWEIETCYTASSTTDTNNDGCPDVPTAGTTCVSDGPRPLTTCHYSFPSRLPDGTVHVSCGTRTLIDYVNPATEDYGGGNVATIRFRHL